MGSQAHTPRNIQDHVHRVSAALALINTGDENPLDAKRWNAKEAYLIQIVAAMPWIYDGEAAKLVGRSNHWVEVRRSHPDFKIAVTKLLAIVSRALAVQMEVLQHRSFDILRERLENPNEDKRFEAAMAVLKGTGVLVPQSTQKVEVTQKFSDFDNDSIKQIRGFLLRKQTEEQRHRAIAARNAPLVLEGTAQHVNEQLREEEAVARG